MITSTRPRKYTRENLTEHARQSSSFAELIKSFGNKPTGGNYVHFQKLCQHFGVDTSHFTGKLWNKGLTADDHSSIAKTARAQSLTHEEVFCERSKATTTRLKKAMLEVGMVYACEECDNPGEWRGRPVTLHVDHRNGVHGDNRRENVRFMCPNCHQQTPTWGRRK